MPFSMGLPVPARPLSRREFFVIMKAPTDQPKPELGGSRGQKEYKKEQCTAGARIGSLTDEEELKGLEETRQAALEMAQEEDEKAKESPEAPQEVGSHAYKHWGYGVVWYPYGLQLWE